MSVNNEGEEGGKLVKLTLKSRRILPQFKLPKIMLPKLWKLPQLVLLRERKLPGIDLPRVRIDFPKDVIVPWEQMEIERVEVVPLKPRDLKIIFRRIPEAERLPESTPEVTKG